MPTQLAGRDAVYLWGRSILEAEEDAGWVNRIHSSSKTQPFDGTNRG